MGKMLDTIRKNMQENRQRASEVKKHRQEIYNEEYNKAVDSALRQRAKKEARAKFGKSRGEKIANAMDEFSKLGSELGGGSPGRSKKKKGKGKKSSGSGFGDFDMDFDFGFDF